MDLPPRSQPVPIGIPRTSIRYVEQPRLVASGKEAGEVVTCMLQQKMAVVGLDTEYMQNPGGEIRLRTVQLAPAVLRGGGLDIWRGVVFDTGCAEVREALSTLLRQPWRFVVHYARAEFESLTAAGLPVPRDLFDTHLAARLCTLGSPDWHDFLESDIEIIGDYECAAARESAQKEQESTLSLLGLCQRFGVEHRFADRKAQMQERFASGTALDEQMVGYAAEDALVVATLYMPVVQQLASQGLLGHLERIELPALPVFLDISRQGATVDPTRLDRVVRAAEQAIEVIQVKLRSQAATLGMTLDRPRSHRQRLQLVRTLGLKHLFRKGRDPDGNPRYSFERDRFLKRHRDRHPAIELLYRHALLSRIPSDRLFQGEFTRSDNRVHSRIEPLGASTGRPSFREPNLGSVPRIFRPAFVAEAPDQAIIEIDYKAQEPGIAAAHFGDMAMATTWNREGDFYTQVGADLGVDIERPRLKVLVLASLYGQTARSTGESLGLEAYQARRLLERFFSRYPDLARGMKDAEDLAHVRGYAETRTGLKRYLSPNLPRHARDRQARNLPVQGGGADVLKMLLPWAHTYLSSVGGRILVPLFDSLVFQVPREVQKKATAVISRLMVMAMQSIYPELRPKLDVNDKDTTCWNKDGHGDAIDRFEKDPFHDIP